MMRKIFTWDGHSANYVVPVQGEFYLVFGTSASSPVMAAILSAVNDARLAIGKKPIGFINPTVRGVGPLNSFVPF